MFTTDNRYGPGASGAEVPDTARAAYAARWIDQGDHARADIVHDRQGFARNDEAAYERLITLMGEKGDALRTPATFDLGRDTVEVVNFGTEWAIAFRRCGGYVYVDAWLS